MNFKNESLTDFSLPANRQAMEQALATVKSQLGRTYSLVIDGKYRKARSTFKSFNPSRPQEVVGILQNADRKMADAALSTAAKAFPGWSQTPVQERAECLRTMAK